MAFKIKSAKRKQNYEQGEASMFVELEDGKVKVYHGDDKSLLFKAKAKEGYWDNVWNALESKKYTKK